MRLLGIIAFIVVLLAQSLHAVAADTKQPQTAFERLFDTFTEVPPCPNVQSEKAITICPGDLLEGSIQGEIVLPSKTLIQDISFTRLTELTRADNTIFFRPLLSVLARTQFDIGTNRALFRLTRLRYVASDGQIVELPTDGWVVGADGIRGMRAKLVQRGTKTQIEVDPAERAIIIFSSLLRFEANEVSSHNSSSLIDDKFEHLINRIDCLNQELSNDPAFDKARCSNISEGNISEAQPHQAESDPETTPPGESEFKIGESYYHLHPLTGR